MSKIDEDKLARFESELQKIKFAPPSEEYIRRGRDIINSQRSSTSSEVLGQQLERSLLSFPFSLNTKTVLASTLLIIGIIVSLVVQGDIKNSQFLKEMDSVSFQTNKNSSHKLFEDFQLLVESRNRSTQEQSAIFNAAAENYLLASCLNCHDEQFLASVTYESFSNSRTDSNRWFNL